MGSTIVPPGWSSPAASSASTIAIPMRSFTEPPGLSISIFATTVGATSLAKRSRRTIGVSPSRASTSGAISRPRSSLTVRGEAARSCVSPTVRS